VPEKQAPKWHCFIDSVDLHSAKIPYTFYYSHIGPLVWFKDLIPSVGIHSTVDNPLVYIPLYLLTFYIASLLLFVYCHISYSFLWFVDMKKGDIYTLIFFEKYLET
jgi:hypothetical protein